MKTEVVEKDVKIEKQKQYIPEKIAMNGNYYQRVSDGYGPKCTDEM